MPQLKAARERIEPRKLGGLGAVEVIRIGCVHDVRKLLIGKLVQIQAQYRLGAAAVIHLFQARDKIRADVRDGLRHV